MKTAISVPDELYRKVESLARRTRKSRSRVVSDALREYLARHLPDQVTDTMNSVIDEVGEETDAFSREAARRTLGRSEW